MGIQLAICIALSILLFASQTTLAQYYGNCDSYQEIQPGKIYYIFNKEYNSTYPPNTACRWVSKSPLNTKIHLSCQLEIPQSYNCQLDKLRISLSGSENLNDGHNYCGTGRISLFSASNTVSIGLFSVDNSPGGKFVCTLKTTESSCECGWKPSTKIVGGHETGVNEYPSMVGLVDLAKRFVYCGASLISTRYVVTAAHCLLNRDPSEVSILAGDHDYKNGHDTPYSDLYQCDIFKIHPNYRTLTQLNDIALIRTKTFIKYSEFVGPICLPFNFGYRSFTNDKVTILGWGQDEFSGALAEKLQEVQLDVIDNYDCASKLDPQKNPITFGQICTFTPGKDACLSDSGGPLIWTPENSIRLYLIGIISYGVGCATPKPSVNTRVNSYLPWIVSEIQDSTYCQK